MNNLMYCFEGFPYPTRGGISQVSIRQSAFFQKHYSIKCYCLCLRVEPECINLQTFNGHIIVDYSFNSSQKIAEYIAEKNISVVVFQVIWNFKLFSIVDKACRLSGAKLISVMHGQPKQGLINIDKCIRENKPVNLRELVVKVFRPLYLKYFYLRQRRHNLYIYNQSDRYVSLVPANEQQLIQFYHMADISKLCSIANPLSFDSFATDKQIALKEQKVLIVGRFEENTKRISLALKIWSEIEKRGVSGWKLIIVGDGEARNMYYQLAKELQLRNISFEGRQNPLMYYQKAAIFMMTSITEGFGLTLTEAQQNGVVPIAANTFPSLGDIIQSGYSGIIVPDGDVKLYVDNLYELMNNSKLRQKLAKSAVESSRRFTLESICAQWYDLFIQVLGEKE